MNTAARNFIFVVKENWTSGQLLGSILLRIHFLAYISVA